MFCSECGMPLNEGQRFCSKCGAPVDAGYQAPDLNMQNASSAGPSQLPPQRPQIPVSQNTAKPQKNNSNKPLIIIIAILAVLLIAVIALLFFNIAGGSSGRDDESSSSRTEKSRHEDEDRDSSKIDDARSLARLIDDAYTEDVCISVSGKGDLSGHVSGSDFDSDMDMSLTYDQKVFPGGEADEKTELHIAAGTARQVTGNRQFSVSMEDDTPVSYFYYKSDLGWQKADGDLLKPLRTHSDVFEQIADGDIDAEYDEDSDAYYLNFTLTGDTLRSFLLQYANLFADEGGIPSSADWDSISAEAALEAHCSSDGSPDSLEISLESRDLADALFRTVNQFDQVSDTAFTLTISVQRYEDLEYELPKDAEGAEYADAAARASITAMFETILDPFGTSSSPFGSSGDTSNSSGAEYASIKEMLQDPDEYDYYMDIARQLIGDVEDVKSSVYADGDTLVIHITYPDYGGDESQDAAFSELLWENMSNNNTQFSLEAIDVADKTGIEKPYIRVYIDMADGYELFDFSYAGGL